MAKPRSIRVPSGGEVGDLVGLKTRRWRLRRLVVIGKALRRMGAGCASGREIAGMGVFALQARSSSADFSTRSSLGTARSLGRDPCSGALRGAPSGVPSAFSSHIDTSLCG
jgi:hypothetical protein